MTGKRVGRRLAILLMTLWVADAATAEAARPDMTARAVEERRIARCIRTAAAGRGWLEKTLWGLRDQEGGWLGAEVANSDGSHDLGPFQINSWWVGKIATITQRQPEQVRWWLMNDPCFNVHAARWIFLSGLAASGEYWKAIGVYHSPNTWRQRRYAASVSNHLRRRYGEQVFGPISASRKTRP